jgi:hypothetical protein
MAWATKIPRQILEPVGGMKNGVAYSFPVSGYKSISKSSLKRVPKSKLREIIKKKASPTVLRL